MIKKLSNTISISTILLLLLAMLSACTGGKTTPTSTPAAQTPQQTAAATQVGIPPTGGKPIKIGTLFLTSGTDASGGQTAENGVRLAVDEANAAKLIPGYTFAIEAKNDGGASSAVDPAAAAANVQALSGEVDVAGIIGPVDAAAQVELPVANQAPVVMLSPAASNPCLTQNSTESGCGGANDILAGVRPTGKVTFFRRLPTTLQQGTAMADFLFKVKGKRTAYALDDTTAYGAALANAFVSAWQKDGGGLLGRASLPPSQAAYINILTQIAAAKPDLIYFGGRGSTGGAALRQLMLQIPGLINLNVIFTDGDGIGSLETEPALLAPGAPVFSSAGALDPNASPAAASFIQQCQASFGPLGAYSSGGYESARILIAAI